MNLRLKLFCTVGAVFLLIAFLTYFLPALLFERDSQELQDKLTSDMRVRYLRLIEKNQQVIDTHIQELQGELDSILYIVNTSLDFEKIASQDKLLQELVPWQRAALLLSFNGRIGMVQQTLKDEVQAAVVLDDTPLHLADVIPFQEGVACIKVKGESYLGMQLPFSQLVYAEGPQPFFLFPWEILLRLDSVIENAKARAGELMPITRVLFSAYAKSPLLDLQQSINGLQRVKNLVLKATGKDVLDAETLKQWVAEASGGKQGPPSAPSKEEAAGSKGGNATSPYSLFLHQLQIREIAGDEGIDQTFEEAIIREHTSYIVRQLTSFVYPSLGVASPFDKNAALGVAYSEGGSFEGVAIFSSSLFYKSPLFDDTVNFDKYPPRNENFPVASQLSLVASPSLSSLFIANTLKLSEQQQGEEYFTVGMRLRPLLQNLALSANVYVVLKKSGQIIDAISSSGKVLPKAFVEKIPLDQFEKSLFGECKVGEDAFFFANVKEMENETIAVYFMLPSNMDLLRQISNVLQTTFQDLSTQFISIILFCFVLALTMLALISRRVTKPIAQLAKATETIAAGNYSKVDLPIDPGKHDEVAILSQSFRKMVLGLQDREKIRGVLNKVVSKDIAEEILKGGVQLGGQEICTTVLFADIRGFTKMTEKLAPHEVIEMLNDFMNKLSHFVDQEGGVIDKYIGDAIMALYGAPVALQDGPWHAVRTGIEMVHFLQSWNVERKQKGLYPIEIGIGIHTGLVVAGNMGSESRLNYTVVGANVNLAARLCEHAKPMQVLVSQATLDFGDIKEKVLYEEEPLMEAKGFSQPIKTYSIIGYRPQ